MPSQAKGRQGANIDSDSSGTFEEKKKNKQMFVLDFIEKTLFAYLKCLSEFSVGQTFE